MKFVQVESSSVGSVGYEAKTATLSIIFRSGTVYSYQGVPSDVHEKFIGADSKGKFFHEFIKESYEYFLLEDIELFPVGSKTTLVAALEQLHNVSSSVL